MRLWVPLLLILAGLLWTSREGFSGMKKPAANDPALISQIKANAPSDVNVAAYVSVVRAFYEDVYAPSADSPTVPAIEAYLARQRGLAAPDRENLKTIISQYFNIESGVPATDREKQLTKFTPDNTALQPAMAAPPVEEVAVPADYETADPEPLLPESKAMFQRPSLDRGGGGEDVAAYTWDLAAYQQDRVQYQSPRLTAPAPVGAIRESMSTMAQTNVRTNEIYGPRIPRKSGIPDAQKEADFSDTRIPMLYAPLGSQGNKIRGGAGADSTKGGAGADAAKGGVGGTGCPVGPQPPAGADLEVLGVTPEQALLTSGVRIPDMPKTEPVPYLPDFSRFFK